MADWLEEKILEIKRVSESERQTRLAGIRHARRLRDDYEAAFSALYWLLYTGASRVHVALDDGTENHINITLGHAEFWLNWGKRTVHVVHHGQSVDYAWSTITEPQKPSFFRTGRAATVVETAKGTLSIKMNGESSPCFTHSDGSPYSNDDLLALFLGPFLE